MLKLTPLESLDTPEALEQMITVWTSMLNGMYACAPLREQVLLTEAIRAAVTKLEAPALE